MTTYCLTLDVATERDLSEIGQKAFSLARMRALGIPVPPGFVVTRQAFDVFLDVNRLRPEISRWEKSQDPEESTTRIKQLVLSASLPIPVWDEVRRLRDEILGQDSSPSIVRSSGVGEDSVGASFAGQLDSISDVRSDTDLDQALRECWASYWSARSLRYRTSRGVSLAGMGVIVQRFLEPIVAGVLFTSSGQHKMIAEYGYGRGEAVVSGLITPGAVEIDRDRPRWTKLRDPEPADSLLGDVLFEDEVLDQLRLLSIAVEAHFDGPQDIEWVLTQDRNISLVQTRPVTAALSIASETTSDMVRWTNTNLTENYPEPMSPLLWSIASRSYYYYFGGLARVLGMSPKRRAAIETALRNAVGVHAGRIYYNLTNIHSSISEMPFGNVLTDWFDDFVGAAREQKNHARSRELVESAVVGVRALWAFGRIEKRAQRFERRVDALVAGCDDLDGRDAVSLADDVRAFLDIRFHRWTDAALCDTAAAISYGALRGLLARWLPGESAESLSNELLKALPDVVSSQPPLELWSLARRLPDDFDEDHPEIRAYIDRWGFRRSGELMLTVPGFDENPRPLLEIIRRYRQLGDEARSPADRMALHQAEGRARLEETTRRLSLLRAGSLRLILRATASSIALRERVRMKQALLYHTFRRVVLALGDHFCKSGWLDHANDVFFLTAEEIESLADGRTMLPETIPELVAARRRAHTRVSRREPPDTFELPRGEYDLDRARPVEAFAGDALMGVGASSGIARGRASVLSDLSEAHRIELGDVLVTRQTDPGWATVFPLVTAIVMERGGMLSHGAIVAREFGIPAVVGVADATRRIEHGSTVEVDGDRGGVRLLD